MSRPTDTERGARIALGIAVMRATQPDLFGDAPDEAFWNEIREHAEAQLEECQAYRRMVHELAIGRVGEWSALSAQA